MASAHQLSIEGLLKGLWIALGNLEGEFRGESRVGNNDIQSTNLVFDGLCNLFNAIVIGDVAVDDKHLAC